MTVFLTGDLHGPIDIGKLGSARFDARGLSRSDELVVLGDFGLPWRWPESREDRYWLDWLEAKPWTTLFVDGNHENFHALSQYPTGVYAGGGVRRLRPHVMHLRRAEAFELGGRSFFAMGGAYSTDRQWRVPLESWWPQEVPNEQMRALAEAKVAELGSVDYVVTHCPPVQELHDLACAFDFEALPDEYAAWLQDEVADKLGFERWFYGHMHVDAPARAPFTPLYDAVLELGAGGWAPSGRVREPGARRAGE